MFNKEINEFIKYLCIYRTFLTKQQFKTLQGKVKQGDMTAARKGLVTILRRQDINVTLGRW